MVRMTLSLALLLPLVAHAELPQTTLPPLPQDTLPPSLNDLWTQAVKESRPLCIWVGYRCPSSADQVPGMLHHHTAAYKDVKGPCVVVLVPGGDGKLYRGEVVSAEKCCAAELRAVVERTLEQWQRASSLPISTTRPVPVATFQHVRGWAMSRNGACVG